MRHCPSSSILANLGFKFLIQLCELENHFIRLLLIVDFPLHERRQKEEIKIAGRLSCSSFIGRTKKEIAWSRDVMVIPRQLIEPDGIAS